RASLLAFRGAGVRLEGVLRRAEPPVRAGEEFSRADATRRAVRHHGPVLVAWMVSATRPGTGGAFPRRRQCGTETGVVHCPGSPGSRWQSCAIVAAAPDDPFGRARLP